MKELLDWLRLQKGALLTYREFQRRGLALLADHPEQAALARLLVDLAGRFADAYDGEPLAINVAEQALGRLTEFVEMAERTKAAPPEERLALLNKIGAAELA